MRPRSLSILPRVAVPLALIGGLAAWIGACGGTARSEAQRLDNGRRIFLASCAMCHGDQGSGDGPLARELAKESGAMPARLNDAARLQTLGREGVKRIIIEGGGHRNRSPLMPAWGDQLKESEAEDVTDFVMALPGLSPGIPAATLEHYLSAPPGAPEEGKRLFVYYCSGCHGLSGKGDGVYARTLRQRDKIWPRNLTETAYFSKKTNRDLFAVISLGGGHVGKSTMMPAWSVTLSPAQVNHLVAYVRALSKTPSQP